MSLLQVQSIFQSSQEHARAPHNEEYANGVAYANGKIVPLEQASIPITDCGLIHSDATYDVVTASKGYIFRLDDHLSRFEASCRKFEFNLDISMEQIGELLHEMVAKSGFKDCYIWWCVTRGAFPSDMNKINPDAYKPNLYAFVIPYRFIADDEMRLKGFSLCVARNHIRISEKAVDPTAKNFHWMDMKLSMFEAYRGGFDWAILTDENGNLTECPGCNIFFIKNNTLYTPQNGCLEGITRKTALELGEELGLEINVGVFQASELLGVEEIFLTSSAGGIFPVASVTIDNETVSLPVRSQTERIHNLYWEKRWQGWHGKKVIYQSDFRY